MSHVFATAGSTLYIGTLPKAFGGTDFAAADFSSVVWTEIGGLSNLGSAGDTSELITFNAIKEKRTRKIKGTRNAGAMQVVAGLDYADAGQLALIEAEKTDYSYPFKVVFNDAPSGGTPSQRLFVAFVMSTAEQWDEANSVMAMNATLEIDSNIARVAATA